MFARRLVPLMLLLALTACERTTELLGLPDPKKEEAAAEAEAKAIGGACRHAGRALEDCYALNPKAQKAAIFSGWREMNDYMTEHHIQTVPPTVTPSLKPAAAETGGESKQAAKH